MDFTALFNPFLAAIQASLSVLLVISYGAIAARLGLLDSATGKTISKICVRMFLPALLFAKIGSELHIESAHRYGILVLWAFIAHLLSFVIGALAHRFLGMADWITVAIMFNNTTSYPLLLIGALDETGILQGLVKNESTKQAIERAKSYFLVFATISSCLTFAVGPRLIHDEHAPEPEVKDNDSDLDGNDGEPNEISPLLQGPNGDEGSPIVSKARRQSVFGILNQKNDDISYNRRPSLIRKRQWIKLGPRARWWLVLLSDLFNEPLIGALIGAVIGLVPALHTAFFSDTEDGGIFTAWFTASIKTIGSLFVPLPVIVAGVSLYTSYVQAKVQSAQAQKDARLPIPTTVFVLIVRFVVWPVMSIALIWVLAKHTNTLGSDPMLWFAMMLMPTGPPAMKLITMVQTSDMAEEEEHVIAKLLTVRQVFSVILQVYTHACRFPTQYLPSWRLLLLQLCEPARTVFQISLMTAKDY
jgi:auxin efflux carrier family protein